MILFGKGKVQIILNALVQGIVILLHELKTVLQWLMSKATQIFSFLSGV